MDRQASGPGAYAGSCASRPARGIVMQSLWLAFALLIGSAITIYLSCELFVNGIEWTGRKLANRRGIVVTAERISSLRS